MTITFLHEMLSETFESLANLFRLHDSCRPTYDCLDADATAVDRQIEAERPPNVPPRPLFVGELVLKPDRVQADPGRKVMLAIFRQFVDLVHASIYGMARFHDADTYEQFTRPCIMGRQEERLGGQTPDINAVLDADWRLNANRKFIFEAIDRAYDTAELYVKRFDPIRLNYQIDVNTEPKTIRAESDVAQLRSYCQRYNDEMRALEGIVESIQLGLLQLKQTTFKEEVIPVCRELLVVLDSHIPK